jgi:predicted nucleic acid-binding protein
LLDTNIVSEISKPQPAPAIADWLRRQTAADLFISTLTMAEIWRGILELPIGRRRRALEVWFAGPEGPRAMFRDRIEVFVERAAFEWGRIMAEGRATGHSRSPIDMIIAATAIANNCVVVTANERYFEGAVEFLNPLRAVC